MPLNKYGTFPNGRINIYNHMLLFKDVAILDYSTSGHGVYEYGNLSTLFYKRIDKTSYNVDLNEVEISLGQADKVFNAVQEIIQDKNIRHIFMLPSSLSATLGYDLNAFVYDIQDKYNIDSSTIFLNLNDDFYQAEICFYNYLYSYIHLIDSEKYNLIGDEVSNSNILKHKKIKKILKEKCNLDCMFDSLEINELSNLTLSNKLNIITSNSALELANKLNIPFIYLNSIDEASDRLFFNNFNINTLFDDDLEYIYMQFRNVIEMTNKKIICYLNIDHLIMMKQLFKFLNLDVTLIATHKNKEFKHLTLDQFIDSYSDNDEIIISNERVANYLTNVIDVEYLGLNYKLLTPFENTYVFYDDGIKLLEKIISLIKI